MNANTQFAVFVLLVVGVLTLSGCVANAPPSDSTGALAPPSSEQVAQTLSGGTGTTEADITASDLDGLQSDLDAIDTDLDEAAQSDI